MGDVLSAPAWHEPGDLTEAEAAEATAPYALLLAAIGPGVKLTSAGYLPPSLVERFAKDSGIADWWIGKVNREDLTTPVADVRLTARDLGLLSVRKGLLSPTVAARRVGSDPLALSQHIASRLPLGRTDFDRQAGWLALAVAGAGVPVAE